MSKMELAKRISEVKQAVWQQDWENAKSKCQAVLDDPDAEEDALLEARRLMALIKNKAKAESEIRLTLETADQALQEPVPDYGSLITRLERAKELGNQHNILRWHTQLLDRLNQSRRRRDVQARFKEDQRKFREARDAGNYDRAIEIAQRLLEDAELHQQPSIADSARQWLSQIGQKIEHDHIASNVKLALDREDFTWAIELFGKLPEGRYGQLRRRVEEAKRSREELNADLNRVESLWQTDKLDEAEVILGELTQRYPKNRTWRPLWLKLYNDAVRRATGQADECLAKGSFAEAGKFYRRAELAYHQLLKVFEDEEHFIRMAHVANACMTVCQRLNEALGSWQRADVPSARAACDQALNYLDEAPISIREETVKLRQRALDLEASLDVLESAQINLKKADDAYHTMDDLDQASAHLEVVLADSPDLPETVREKAETLRDRVDERLERVEALTGEARVSKTADPKRAAEVYLEAWQLSHLLDLRDEMIGFFWERFRASEREDPDWLQHILTVEPENEKAQEGLKTLEQLPELEQELLPLEAKLEELEGTLKPSLPQIKNLGEQIKMLEDKAATDDLRSRVEETRSAWELLHTTVKDAQRVAKSARQQRLGGNWQSAIEALREAAEGFHVGSQRRRLLQHADEMEETFRQAHSAYQDARESYQAAIQAYQDTPDTRNYEGVFRQVQQASEQLDIALAPLEGAVPRLWRDFREDLTLFERKTEMVAQTWEARRSRQQPLAELTLELRDVVDQDKRHDPVVADLLNDLTQRAIDECVQLANQAEQDGFNKRAQEHLSMALELGDDDPNLQELVEDIRARLIILTERQERTERIDELSNRIRVLLTQSGRLPDVIKLQTKLMRLMVKDTGREEWGEAIERVVNAIPSDLEVALQDMMRSGEYGEADSDLAGIKQTRQLYQQQLQNAESHIDRLEELIGDKDMLSKRIVEEARNWLRYKKRLVIYSVATSVGVLGEHIESVKMFKRLRDEAKPTEYKYDAEFENARNAMFDAVLSSADKRRSAADELIKQGQYDLAVEQLEQIEGQFYGPVEQEFPDFHSRLSEEFTPLGTLRREAESLLRKAERLQELTARLRKKEDDAAQLWRQVVPPSDMESGEKEAALNEALAILQDARRDDPDEECVRALKRIEKLEEQIREALRDQKRRRARLAVSRAERQLRGARTEENYKAIDALLAEIDLEVLTTDYRSRYNSVLELMKQRRALPAKLRLADQEFRQGHYTVARDYYEQALGIDPTLSRDLNFSAQYQEAKRRAESQDQVAKLMDQATVEMSSDPASALKLLDEALVKADLRGMDNQVERIERLIDRTKARQELEEAESALSQDHLMEARRAAARAQRFAERCNDERIRIEANQILGEVADRGEELEESKEKRVEARRSMRNRQWEQALDILDDLGIAPDDMLFQQAQMGNIKADEIERKIRESVEDGDFVEARNYLNRGIIELALADDVAERLRQEIESAERQFSQWEGDLQHVVRDITHVREVSISTVEKTISEVDRLTEQQELPLYLRDTMKELRAQLHTLQQQLSKVSRVIEEAEDSLNAREFNAALSTLSALEENLILQYGNQTHEIRHGGSDRIRQIRHDAISRQFAQMQRRLESADDSLAPVLLTLRDTWDSFRQHLSTHENIEKFNDLRAQLTEVIVTKRNATLCDTWKKELQDAEEFFKAGQIETALQIAQSVEEEANMRYQDGETPIRNLTVIRDVWKSAFRLVGEIEEKKAHEVEEQVRHALRKAEQAVAQGDVHQIVEVESHLEDLLQDTRLTEGQASRIQSRLRRLSKAKEAIEEATSNLSKVERLLNLREYERAAQILVEPCPIPLQPRWDALGQVVMMISEARELLQKGTGTSFGERSTKLREYDSVLQRCIHIHDEWPKVLPETDGWLRRLRGDVSALGDRLRRALCEVTRREASSALDRGDSDEAERLVETAREQHWITEGEEDRFEDLTHEISIARASLALESALTDLRTDIEKNSTILRNLLRERYDISQRRRQGALGLLRLVEIRQLLDRGNIELAQEYLADQTLINLEPFETISREVTAAKRHQDKISGLVRKLDDVIYATAPDSLVDVVNWLPEASRLADAGNAVIEEKLDKVRRRVQEEVDAARQQAEFAFLRTLNPLAHELGLDEPSLADLEFERKQKLQEELTEARQSLATYEPEHAARHLDLAERLSEREQDRAVVEDLRADLRSVQKTCQEVDGLIEEADLKVSRGEHAAAVEAYRKAEEKAHHRSTVRRFADSQHGLLQRTFKKHVRQEQYFQAGEVVDRALDFGFETIYWKSARQDLQQERDEKIELLIERLAGPGYDINAQDPKVFNSGALGSPDPDLGKAKDELKQALSWDPGNKRLDHLLFVVEGRLKQVAEVRLNVRRGWYALDSADYETALELFRSGAKQLPGEHPEVIRWARIAEFLAQADAQLANLEQTENPIDIEMLPGDVYRVTTHPAWEKARHGLRRASGVFADPVQTQLLGKEGIKRQMEYRAQAKRWQQMTEDFNRCLEAMQHCYDNGNYQEAPRHKKQAEDRLDTLRYAVHRNDISVARTTVAPSESTDTDKALMAQQPSAAPVAKPVTGDTEFDKSHDVELEQELKEATVTDIEKVDAQIADVLTRAIHGAESAELSDKSSKSEDLSGSTVESHGIGGEEARQNLPAAGEEEFAGTETLALSSAEEEVPLSPKPTEDRASALAPQKNEGIPLPVSGAQTDKHEGDPSSIVKETAKGLEEEQMGVQYADAAPAPKAKYDEDQYQQDEPEEHEPGVEPPEPPSEEDEETFF